MNAPNREIRAHDDLEVTPSQLEDRLETEGRPSRINWERWIIFALICGTWANAILLLF